MILGISIALVIIGSLGLGLFLLRKRQKHDPLALTGAVMAGLALLFSCGVAIQQYVDNERASATAARRDELMIALADVLAQIQREMIRTDISPLAKQERLATLVERYNRIRAAIAETSDMAPAPTLTIPRAPNGSPPSANETAASGSESATAPVRITSRPRATRPEDDDTDASIAPATTIPPPPVMTPPPPPPPPI